jgi:hypothetical protein
MKSREPDMLKVMTAATALALIAGASAAVPPRAASVEANTSPAAAKVEVNTPPAAAKDDRLDTGPTAAACSQRAWPYYEIKCLRDPMQPAGQARKVRMVSPDRLAGRGSQTAK